MSPLKPFLKFTTVVLLMFCSQHIFSQPTADYSFSSYTHISGTDRAVGAVYRFTGVKTGVDALVTITGAVNATLATFDQTGQGWGVAFQPNVTVTSMTTGYIDFRIDFVVAGGNTPSVQGQVAVTAMDVDGYNFNANQRLFEFEQFNMGPNTYTDYEFAGGDIAISYLGNAVRGQNTAGVEYGSINTNSKVRFTVINSNVTSLTVRSGAVNGDQFNNVTRQRSFYFAQFTYPNSALLAVSDLKSFTVGGQQGAVQLNWTLQKEHSIGKIDIERSSNNETFVQIHSVLNPQAGNSNFADPAAAAGENYYRLKLYEKDGTFFYSKVIVVTNHLDWKDMISIPSIIYNNQCRVSISSEQPTEAVIMLTTASGQVVASRKTTVQGFNNVVVMEIGSLLPSGTYFVVVKTATAKKTGKIYLQH